MPQPEPVFEEKKDRFVIFPIKHNDIWDWYKKMEAGYWRPGEIDLQQDLRDWENKLTAEERHFIKNILGHLAGTHQLIKENLVKNLLYKIAYPEARYFLDFQVMMENLHSRASSLLLETFIKDESEKEKLSSKIENSPILKEKAGWLSKWMGSDSPATRLVALAAAEAIFFSGTFSAVSEFQKRELMPGLSLMNKLVSRGENMHSDFAVHLHNNHLVNSLSKSRIREMILEALEIEREFVIQNLPVSQVGIDHQQMNQHLEFVADKLLLKLGFPEGYGVANPFESLESEEQGQNRLLEKRVSQLQKTGSANKDKESDKISSNADN